MNTPQRRGMASLGDLHSLHRQVARACMSSLKGTPGVEDLEVASRFLKMNALHLSTVTPKDRAKLQRLWGLLLEQLTTALKSDRPTASMLDVTRLFLASNGISKGQHSGDPLDTVEALEGLADVPFNIH